MCVCLFECYMVGMCGGGAHCVYIYMYMHRCMTCMSLPDVCWGMCVMCVCVCMCVCVYVCVHMSHLGVY